MEIDDFKNYALRTLTEEHLWKIGEQDGFIVCHTHYIMEKIDEGCWSLTNKANNVGETFSTMGRLFSHLFMKHNIKI